jgi:hypothetical protein
VSPVIFHVGEPKLILSCLNSDIYATTSFAFVSLLTFSPSLEKDIHNYVTSSTKLGMSIRRFTNLDLLLMIPIVQEEEEFINKVLMSNWNALRNAGWKVCMVPNIQPNQETGDKRLYQAKVFSKLNAWKFTEYDALVFVDLDFFCISNPSELFTFYYHDMISSKKSFAAHMDHPPKNVSRSLIYTILNKCNLGGSIFNSGLMLFIPSSAEFQRLIGRMNTNDYNPMWADQGFLNAQYGQTYYQLPFKYNANVVCKQCEPELWNQKKHEIVFYHFTVAKPWRIQECGFHNLIQECTRWQNFQPNSLAEYFNQTADVTFIDTID